MSVEPNEMLLHYRLIEKVGEGGMGVVWKAIDTTLDREVAIKILPDALASDTERMARFERQARMLASLNHPNIASIYGCHLGNQDGPRAFLAMELVDGEDLEQRLQRGRLPIDQTLTIMIQVAEALERAHEGGVIHRDLKPANIKLTTDGQAKVLDFGLAKAVTASEPDSAASPSISPTMTSAGTQAGMILGTAAYMSPEQAKGLELDRRADVWSFGVVLYELLSGRRLFGTDGVSETLARVILGDIDIDGLPPQTPGQARRLIERCLDRDPRTRLRDIGEARIQLAEALEQPEPAVEQAQSNQSSLLAWVCAGVALMIAVAGWFLRPVPEPAPKDVMRFAFALSDNHEVPDVNLPRLALSPDGGTLVYIGESEKGEPQLFRRRFDRDRSTPIEGTARANTPFFSPDGEWLAFEQGGELRRIPAEGGPITTLSAVPRLRGAHWGSDGRIVISPDRATGLSTIPESGGELKPLTTIEDQSASLSSGSHRWPHFLPGGRHVLFTATPNNSKYDDAEIRVVSLDDGSIKTLVKGYYSSYLEPGYLIFARRSSLYVARLDVERLELIGTPVEAIDNVRSPVFWGVSQYAVSPNGTLVFAPGAGDVEQRDLVWIDRQGRQLPRPVGVRSAVTRNRYRLSPNGVNVVLQDRREESDLWLLDLERGTRSRFTSGPRPESSPIWGPNGEWVAYNSLIEGEMNVFRRRADGTDEELLATSALNVHLEDWSPDGNTIVMTLRTLVVDSLDRARNSDIWLLHLDEDPPRTEAWLETEANETRPRFSRDGKWLLYSSDETGEPEIYVRPVASQGIAQRVSVTGGSMASWSPVADELVYRSIATDDLLGLSFSVNGNRMEFGSPELVFSNSREHTQFQFSPDGQRILVDVDLGDVRSRNPLAVILNWPTELEELLGS